MMFQDKSNFRHARTDTQMVHARMRSHMRALACTTYVNRAAMAGGHGETEDEERPSIASDPGWQQLQQEQGGSGGANPGAEPSSSAGGMCRSCPSHCTSIPSGLLPQCKGCT